MLSSMVSAQDCSLRLRVRVLESGSNMPVPQAAIWVNELEKGFITDDNGQVSINNLCAGSYTLEIHSMGFKEVNKVFALKTSISETITLQMEELQLQDVEVYGHRERIMSTTTLQTLRQEDLDRTKGGTLASALQGIAGVNMLQTGATISKPVIHGMHSNRVLILNNGIRQEGQQWGFEHAPEIDPFVAQEMTVVKGAEAVRFGPDAIGGVVIVEPPKLPTTGNISGEINAVGATNGRMGVVSGMLNGGIKKLPGWGWRVQGTAKRSGNIKTPDYYLNNTGVNELNFSTAFGYTDQNKGLEIYYSHFDTELGIFEGSHIGSLRDFNERIENGRPFVEGSFSYDIGAPRQQVYHDLIKAKAHLHLANGGKLNFLYGLQRNQRQEYDIRRGDNSNIPSLDMVLTTQTMDLFWEKNTDAGYSTQVGINGLLQVNNNIPGTAVTPLIPNYDNVGAGAYAIQRLIKTKYELEIGARYDFRNLDALGFNREGELYGGTHQFNNFTGTVGAIWYPNNKLSLRTNLGTAWRAPTVNELYSDGLHHGIGAIERGSDDLESEQSIKWINTLNYQTDNWSVELSGYANYIGSYIYLEPSGEVEQFFLRGAFPVFEYKQTDALFFGIDLLSRYRISKALEWELKASLIRARDISTDSFLPWIPTDRIENGFKVNLPTMGKLSKNFLKIENVLVAEQIRYEPESDFAAPPSAYYLINMHAGTSINFGKNELGINLSLTNATDVLYKDYMNRFRYYAHEIGRNLTLRATYRF